MASIGGFYDARTDTFLSSSLFSVVPPPGAISKTNPKKSSFNTIFSDSFKDKFEIMDIKPELELYDHGHLDVALRLLDEGLLEPPLQFSLVLGVVGGMAATPANLIHLLASIPPGSAWQVIAIGRANLEMTTIGLAMGGNARTGMEDTLRLRRGVPVSGNDELVARLAGIARAIERPPASVEQASELLGLG